ncbi:MAG: DUF2075 domain-containing protein [Bacteroidaceae bacterium]|nr:DUF2075 domain-containing protein [Bacteroidaceae bacterium]
MWKNIKKAINKEYQINAYRVLLTRARQGMVIVVPNGDNGMPPDEIRKPEWYVQVCHSHTYSDYEFEPMLAAEE